MTDRSNSPELVIAYSPHFRLEIGLKTAVHYREAGGEEHRFAVKYRVLHPSGYFEYFGDDICFSLQAFQEFAEQLAAIQAGKANTGALKQVGEMIVFRVDQQGRRTKAGIKIVEFQPFGEMSRLEAAFEVDRDLFVNKLASDVATFLGSLKEVPLDRI